MDDGLFVENTLIVEVQVNRTVELLSKIIGIALTLLLWYLQEMPQISDTWYDNLLKENKYNIALYAMMITIAAISLDYLLSYRKQTKSVKMWMGSFLKHIIKEHLEGRNFHTRISILRPQKGYKLILSYLICYPLKAFFSKHHKICNKAYWENVPYKIFDDYLVVYARYGHSDKYTSYTHFLLTNRNEPCNGLADKCYKEERELEVHTTSISGIALPKRYEEANDKIKKYMDESCISSAYYSTLLAMNTKANNLYAVPIFYEDQRICGVMMIDNDSPKKISYKTKLDGHIAKYQKIISYTIKTLN